MFCFDVALQAARKPHVSETLRSRYKHRRYFQNLIKCSCTLIFTFAAVRTLRIPDEEDMEVTDEGGSTASEAGVVRFILGEL